ncbi:hypothetical protein AQJ84_26550 [Streptomyces resistomycificus]|uniref:Chlorophyllase n=1 Tax=Streptomyces resistomycificus TaxID=67356 RepID=A0A0L8L024_9ACTN|nr:hypothetical protein ADK37_30970 [Streptomyces resistomycificus]KUN94257.1 hypothetical protein AQJ84_26550 [Streptomyces resistomycificus]
MTSSFDSFPIGNAKKDLPMTASDAAATDVAITAPSPIVSVKPVVLEAPGRSEGLRVRISAPTTGSELPIIVFSHGFGSSLNGYGPLADFWAAHTTDENPERVALVQRVTWAYLRHALGIEDTNWTADQKALSASVAPMGRIESK